MQKVEHEECPTPVVCVCSLFLSYTHFATNTTSAFFNEHLYERRGESRSSLLPMCRFAAGGRRERLLKGCSWTVVNKILHQTCGKSEIVHPAGLL